MSIESVVVRKSVVVLLAVGLLASSAGAAFAEPRHDVAYSAGFVLGAKARGPSLAEYSVTKCSDALAQLREKGTNPIRFWNDDGLRKFGAVVISSDVYELSLENIEKLCKEYSVYWVAGSHRHELKGMAAFVDTPSKHTVESAKRLIEEANKCVTLVDEMLAAGVPGSTPFTLASGSTDITKTLDDVKPNLCERIRASGQRLTADVEAEEAPLRKVLKADKLDVVLANKQAQFFGPGKKPLNTPEQMAKVNVWLRHLWSLDDECRDGRPVHTVRRYKFNAKHLLVDSGDTTYCGAPPTSAFR
jgi:hypothetical protein